MKVASKVVLAVLLVFGAAVYGAGGEHSAQIIEIDAGTVGRMFEGIGALSAGASSRLLIDYPEPQRAQILDVLFKPKYGASLHHLKVEIGGMVNSTDGSEPSHAHTRDEFENPKPEYYQRGYEWWLMKEAKKRNPKIFLDTLPWGAPGWIGGGEYYSQDMADYIARFIKGAKKYHGLEIDYTGIWNEHAPDLEWIKLLAGTLKRNGLGDVKIVAADLTSEHMWQIAEDMKNDPQLRDAVDVIGGHYPERDFKYGTTQIAKDTGKSLWNSEGGSLRGGGWDTFDDYARIYNRCYVEGRMTKVITWSLISSYYDILPWPGSGLMLANTPWCGSFEIKPPIWAAAHTTQFAEPGWKYIDSGCGYLDGKAGSFVTLLKPGREKDYSIIIETMDANEPQDVVFKLPKSFSKKKVSVWRSVLNKETFIRQDDIAPKAGQFQMHIEPNSLYSVTTTSGQRKGEPKSPAYIPFAKEYEMDFEDEEIGKSVKYFSDICGVFEVAERSDGKGKCLRQLMDSRGIKWAYRANRAGPYSYQTTILGEIGWADYEVSCDVYLDGPGSVLLLGRLGGFSWPTAVWPSKSIWLEVNTLGNWKLFAGQLLLVRGDTDFAERKWHNLKLVFEGTSISIFINGEEVHTITAKEFRKSFAKKITGMGDEFKNGLVGIGSGYNVVEFDNFKVKVSREIEQE